MCLTFFHCLLHRRPLDWHRFWSLPVLGEIKRNDPLWVKSEILIQQYNFCSSNEEGMERTSFCVISSFLFMISDWLLTLTQLLFFSFLFSLTHMWSFIHSLLVWTKTISLSSLPPSQSCVDHREFKRCGPFDPYINAKVCTLCCWNYLSF